MLTLYYKPTCPFSKRVLDEAESLGVTFELKDVTDNDVLRAELVEKGGKVQTPYLIDDEHSIAMYESRDIVHHLQEHYGDGAVKTEDPKVCNVCQITT